MVLSRSIIMVCSQELLRIVRVGWQCFLFFFLFFSLVEENDGLLFVGSNVATPNYPLLYSDSK
jgi:hypothetical protein